MVSDFHLFDLEILLFDIFQLKINCLVHGKNAPNWKKKKEGKNSVGSLFEVPWWFIFTNKIKKNKKNDDNELLWGEISFVAYLLRYLRGCWNYDWIAADQFVNWILLFLLLLQWHWRKFFCYCFIYISSSLYLDWMDGKPSFLVCIFYL